MVCQNVLQLRKKYIFWYRKKNLIFFRKFRKFSMKNVKGNFRWNFQIFKIFENSEREKNVETKKNFFSGVGNFFDILYRSEILSTFDFWHFQGDLRPLEYVFLKSGFCTSEPDSRYMVAQNREIFSPKKTCKNFQTNISSRKKNFFEKTFFFRHTID